MKLQINPSSPTPIVEQVVCGISAWIEREGVRSGARLPSIRRLAAEHGISRNTAIEAYDRLVARGMQKSRQGSGFFLADRAPKSLSGQGSSNPELAGQVTDQMWSLFAEDAKRLKLGCGWVPESWREVDDLAYAIRQVTRRERAGLFEYSTPLGSAALRKLVQGRLRLMDIFADSDRILLTTGASHALDLLIRYLVKPGDTVLVESPGYYNLFGLLKLQGIQMLGVPRTDQGPDLESLEQLLQSHRPKLFFVNSVLQNPTGSTLTPAVAHRLLQLAERYDFTLIEDDIYADLQCEPTVRMAALDGFNRVIYLSSFSKSLSSSLRVGFIAAEPRVIKGLVDIKMLTSIASSRFAETVVATMLENGSYRKMVERLGLRMARQMAATLPVMEKAGWEIFTEPDGGMFVWARHPAFESSEELVAAAQKLDISLSKGSMFTPDMRQGPWLRINVTYASDPRAAAFLASPPLPRSSAAQPLAMEMSL